MRKPHFAAIWGCAPSENPLFWPPLLSSLQAPAPDPENMAASIKALAQSVHGDGTELFGDLPTRRTRVTTAEIGKRWARLDGNFTLTFGLSCWGTMLVISLSTVWFSCLLGALLRQRLRAVVFWDLSVVDQSQVNHGPLWRSGCVIYNVVLLKSNKMTLVWLGGEWGSFWCKYRVLDLAIVTWYLSRWPRSHIDVDWQVIKTCCVAFDLITWGALSGDTIVRWTFVTRD